MATKMKFTDEVTLPSKGILYPDALVPNGTMTIQMMGVQEEAYLAGSRGNSSKVMSEILDRIIVSPEKTKSRDLLMDDRMYLLMKMRILTYGAKYNFASECGRCGVSSRIEVDLTTLDVIDLPDTFIEPFECSLPICGEKIWLKFLRGYDDEAVMAYVKRGSDRGAPILGDPAYIPMIAKAIHHTDKITETDEPGKILFVQNLKSLDSLTISDTVDSHKFGIEMKRTFTCPSCGNESEGNIPFNEEFFRPKLRRAT